MSDEEEPDAFGLYHRSVHKDFKGSRPVRTIKLPKRNRVNVINKWPTCAVCKKPVERLESIDSPRDDEIVYVAHCHGAREETRVPMTMLMQAETVTLGEAFAAKRLP